MCTALFRSLPALLSACLLASCASPPPPKDLSYVALLESPDGTVGKVVVKGSKGEQIIDQARYGALLDGSAAPAAVDELTLQRDFADARAARPELPVHYILYFETGGAQLTPESQALLPRIVDAASKRSSVDVSITGHSDTVGKAEVNEALSLKRAQVVAELIKAQGLKVDQVSVESHGERNLLIPTPDETPEPRNRRVEITIR
ncbi:OmpA family protein [Rhodoferax sp. GW822-FHT02A01]|uniref:OmpA family protein n=1 Tax=Rhodoferax sp. GW822-FHT02A01 TaxID=3141537 RepID=UPI00315CBB13